MSMKRLCIASLLGALVVHSCMFELANCASNYTDQLALLAFKSSINFDPNNVLSNWTKETNFCDWVGILCSRRRQRVTSLRLLNMGLQGTISPHIGNLSFLQVFIIHNNSFHGHLPNEFECLRRLKKLIVQHNMLEGSIPVGLHRCQNLQVISLSANNFSGDIPKELSTLPFLRILFLGRNNNLQGNEERCGNSILQVRPCPHQSSQRLRTKDVLLRYIVPAIALLVIFSSLLWIVKGHRRKNVRGQHSNDLLATIEHKKISYQELQRATTNFCEANLLGVGSYGSVYKGILSDGTIVAIKILNLQVEGAFRSFDTECEVLRTTRHRNLVRVITTCSSPELRALVLQYMSNGSLDKCLYSHSCCLNLFQRVSIMIDVALALEYLHDGQSEPVVHCDLKPSNVLVDEDMIAHVADFGITKILAENKTATQTNTLGTLGYIAPEYGCEGRVSMGEHTAS
ncbi:LRR receptor-like serine/threonine-protein kinase EFR isoform X3 [Camellia sinensis]|uniref:LRR receptor-like serine/threonine-protein kinase EFR isoform X3 n=1 Tax=Camellia sinensis TaxID=4442 RepID=UPI00103607B3|nr:LRR receptor-like serine/threonine-protein kinase EFR isoform X3 [Camellia sinensis]